MSRELIPKFDELVDAVNKLTEAVQAQARNEPNGGQVPEPTPSPIPPEPEPGPPALPPIFIPPDIRLPFQMLRRYF